ncbi:hypothetical protein CRN84_12290 [Budvicia aquatica]|nr:hypothetical protein CRN84_12290 [Budvicia aquatica]
MKIRIINTVVTATVGCVSFLLVMMSLGAQAQSVSTQSIKGRVPTASGNILIQGPGGLVIEDNVAVSLSAAPAQFSVSPDTTDLILSDSDGDLGLTAEVDSAAGTLIWTSHQTPLTAEQVARAFGAEFAGRTLTVRASAPVTVSSRDGDPRSGTQTLHSATYTLHVPELPLPVTALLVGGAEFPVTSGFPTQGFVGATFQVRLGDTVANNALYTWSTQSDWVSVDSQGRVSFMATPSSTHKTVVIKAIDKVGGGESIYTFTVNEWFIHQGSVAGTASQADSACAAQSGGNYAVPSWTRLSAGPGSARAGDGPLWNAWGSLSAYGAGWHDYSYWARETQGGNRYDVYLASGNVGNNPPASLWFITCSQSL